MRVGVRLLKFGVALRIDQDGKRRQAELRCVELLQRLQHRGGKIHAASYRFGEDHVGPDSQEALGGCGEVSKAAAEAGAGYFTGIETGGGGHARIHQRAALIVGNDGGAQTAFVQQARGAQEQGSLARAQEAAGKDQGGAVRQAAPTLRRRGW
jgi:hypothetical protein